MLNHEDTKAPRGTKVHEELKLFLSEIFLPQSYAELFTEVDRRRKTGVPL
jgi:hypothetical protein